MNEVYITYKECLGNSYRLLSDDLKVTHAKLLKFLISKNLSSKMEILSTFHLRKACLAIYAVIQNS